MITGNKSKTLKVHISCKCECKFDSNSNRSILVYNISYKTFIGSKQLHISFDKIDGFIRVYDEIKYLVLF